MNLNDALRAFEAASPPARPGLSVTPSVAGGALHIEVRHRDTDAVRGFDVVAEPLPSEQRSAEQLGQDAAQVVERELGYGQLPAAGEDGHFKRVVT